MTSRPGEPFAVRAYQFWIAPDDLAAGSVVAPAGYSRRRLLDRMIAAQAVVHRATLVTFNRADLADVVGLQLEAW